MALLFNGDNGANYWTESAIFNAATATVAETLANTSVYGEMPAAGATANLFATMVIDIIGYASTTKIKQATIVETYAKALSTTNLLTEQHGNFWNSTAAINQISVAAGNGNLVAGSSMTIYGIP